MPRNTIHQGFWSSVPSRGRQDLQDTSTFDVDRIAKADSTRLGSVPLGYSHGSLEQPPAAVSAIVASSDEVTRS